MCQDARELAWIDQQGQAMTRLVAALAAINSHSRNIAGLTRMAEAAVQAFAPLQAQVSWHDLPPMPTVDDRGQAIEFALGRAVCLSKRPAAPRRVLLAIHLDTVYPPADGPQPVTRQGQLMRGPGVADAKGGLVVMLTALRAFEQSRAAGELGWDVVLNPDEELGSPGSIRLLRRHAARCRLGLVFEPTLPDGALVGARGGSGNFTLVIRGKAAHVGRDFASGRSAISALADAIGALDAMSDPQRIIVNVGSVHADGPVNVVPDLAIARLNVRFSCGDLQAVCERRLGRMVAQLNDRPGITAALHGAISAPAKPLDAPTAALLAAAIDCGRAVGLELAHRHSAGVCDGNRLAAAGLTTLDTLGPCGGELHSRREYVALPSLARRAKLTALLLMRLARGELVLPEAAPTGKERE